MGDRKPEDTMTRQEAEARVAEVLSRASADRDIGRLLAFCVGRLMLRNLLSGYPADRNMGTPAQMRHVVDWLETSILTDAAWLSQTDDLGRPRKLMKFASFDQIVAEADKAMKKAVQQFREIRIAEGDEELVDRLDDGYYLVRLMTPEALDRESGQMQHCIGTGPYDRFLETGEYLFYSLRDPSGNPHATMEVTGASGYITQLTGKQNRDPDRRYVELLAPAMKRMKLDPSGLERPDWMMDRDYVIHNPLALPDGAVIRGNLCIAGTGEVILPRTLFVDGLLQIAGCLVVRMPEELVVTGNLRIEQTDEIRKAGRIDVGGRIDIIECGLPDGRIADAVEADVLHLKEIDDDFTIPDRGIRREIDIDDCGISAITYRGILETLRLKKVPIEEIPADLAITKSLYITRSSLRRLPEGFKTPPSLTVSYSPLEELPVGLTVETLDISGTSMTSLPRGLVVGKSLSACDAAIRSLPEDATLMGHINLLGSAIRRLPDGLKVGGLLDVSHAKSLERLPDDLEVDELCAGMSSVRRIGRRLVVRRAANFIGAAVVAIPADAEFHGDAHFRGCDGLHTVGKAFFGADLDLSGTAIQELPAGLDVPGDLNVSRTPLERFPKSGTVGSELYHVGVQAVPGEGFVVGGRTLSGTGNGP